MQMDAPQLTVGRPAAAPPGELYDNPHKANVPIFFAALRATRYQGYPLTECMIQELCKLVCSMKDWFCVRSDLEQKAIYEQRKDICVNEAYLDVEVGEQPDGVEAQCRAVLRHELETLNLTFYDLWTDLWPEVGKMLPQLPNLDGRPSAMTGTRMWAEAWVITVSADTADSQGDDAFASWIRDFLEDHLPMSCISSNESWQDFAAQDTGLLFPGFSLSLLNLRYLTQNNAETHRKTVLAVLGHYFGLGQLAVDIFRTSFDGVDFNSDLRRRGIKFACSAVQRLLQDPHSAVHMYTENTGYTDEISITKEAKELITKSNVPGDIEYLISIVLSSCKSDGHANPELGWLMFQWLTDCALHPHTSRIPTSDETVKSWLLTLFDMGELSAAWGNFRPPVRVYPVFVEGYHDQEESDVEPHVDDLTDVDYQDQEESDAELYEDDFTDVALEPYGPRINVDAYGAIVKRVPSDVKCTYCQFDLKDGEDKNPSTVIKLKVCKHQFHLDCIDKWVNGVFRGKIAVSCPNCRTDICAPRPVRVAQDAVSEN
jgi:hypothetical protein